MTATRQQRGVQTAVLSVRIPPELAEWLREYARAQGVSLNMAAAQVIRDAISAEADFRRRGGTGVR